jgi:hypothetical protein
MVLQLELYGCLLFFAAICLGGALITFFFIPETKGKSLIADDEKESSFMLDPTEKKVQILPAQQ